MKSVPIKCSNCDRSTLLLLKVKIVKEMSTKFVLNTKWYHVDLSWIIYSSKKINYDIKENNHPDWLNKVPRYNTAKMLGLNSFITIMKIEKIAHEAMKKLFKQITNIKSKPLSHDKKNKTVDTDKYWLCVLLETLVSLKFFCSLENKNIFTSER